ncbi:rod shape-determining protein RodA [Planomonospora parontospora subsp. parontospora]|uniref:peptidoglycan glycosyltransferase n=2 Tax=Planomonospora parontospora TaxID=58119 RepID=A0AA37BG13_9ACTN|nr:rod shape-determining protein RodA [Planomonospora parontospora]GGK65083.1 rod shape-determining protein RodA [Planomonospora parontospora]GII08010.1 rod shape-determining protein RodA [Planomonospora parontospora subsp. parontospora]
MVNRVIAAADRSFARRAVGAASPVWRVDGVLAVAVAALAVISVLMVWSSTRTWAPGSTGLVKKHVLNLGVGAALAVAVTAVSHRTVRAYAPLVYGAALLGLILVITPVGAEVNGAHSWIMLGGGFAFQPSEFAKLGLVLMLAMLLAQPAEGSDRPRGPDVVVALVVAAVTMGLVMLQPDFGTTMVLGVITAAALVLSGIRKRWLVLLLLAVAAAGAAVWRLDVLEPYQVARFTAFLDPSTDPRGVGYNSTQSLNAVGSGRLFGKGLFGGGQTMGRFVPEQHTDFVFTVVGEEFGFLGSVTVVMLLGVVLLRAVRIARRCGDRFGTLVAGSIVCWLAFQTFVNVGMTIGIMPITGLPLPFVSYGGTATFANMIAIGLLQAVHLRSRPF